MGHWTDPQAATGCTVILFERGAAAAVDVRGSAPGTRETDVLRPGNLVDRIDAVLLTGGSAYGLDAASGVMAWCEARGMGFETPVRRVPIVAAAVLYDLDLGDPRRWPQMADGHAACEAALSDDDAGRLQGCVGAGAGATVGKRFGPAYRMKGGLGAAVAALPTGHHMACVVAVNCVGEVVDPATGRWVAGAYDHDARSPVDVAFRPPGGVPPARRVPQPGSGPGPGQATTLGCVTTDLPLTAADLGRVASMAQDGLARAVRPSHTLWDGDTIFAASTGEGAPYGGMERAVAVSLAGAMAADLMGQAILSGVMAARSLAGVPSAHDAGTAPTGRSRVQARPGRD